MKKNNSILGFFVGIFLFLTPGFVLAQSLPKDFTVEFIPKATTIGYNLANNTSTAYTYTFSYFKGTIASSTVPLTLQPGSSKNGSLSGFTSDTQYTISVSLKDTATSTQVSKQSFTVTTLKSTTGGSTPGSTTTGGSTPGSTTTGGSTPGSTTTGGSIVPIGLEDPLGSNTTIDGLVAKLLDIVVTIGVPLVAFFLIWAGFKFVSAQGNEEKLQSAKSTLTYTIIGAIVLLGAWTIAQAIKGSIDELKKTSYKNPINIQRT